MHLFTLIQVALLIALIFIKISPLALAFPFFVLLLVPIRSFLLPLIFTHDELHALDGHGDGDNEETAVATAAQLTDDS